MAQAQTKPSGTNGAKRQDIVASSLLDSTFEDDDFLIEDGSAGPDLSMLNEQQLAAYHTLVNFSLGKTDAAMATLRGFAGTGKTFLISYVIQAAQNAGLTIAVAAPTNKAVRVLREKIQEQQGRDIEADPLDAKDAYERKRMPAPEPGSISFGSVHSLLGLKLSERDDGSQECLSMSDAKLHQYHLVVIDECSMISDDLFNRIVASKRRARVLFIGDPAQLPPVDAKEAISPTFAKVSLEVTLSEVVRQAADNPIIKLSMMIRKAIESNQRVDATAIAESLPCSNEQSKAAMVFGGDDVVINFALFELKAGRDARILAFTNKAVLAYNEAIHEALHGVTLFPFVAGERVIAHSQCEVLSVDSEGEPTGGTSILITSEEAVIEEVRDKKHPIFKSIPARQMILVRDTGSKVAAYVAENPDALDREISEKFAENRRLKGEATSAERAGDYVTANKLVAEAKKAAKSGWAMRRAFSPLRHSYALTTHKSQGSTFDTAIVDFADMARMRSTFDFNRGLYVATTRSREYLALVA